MLKTILLCSLTFSTSLFANVGGVQSNSGVSGIDDPFILVVVKECFDHDALYETHHLINGQFPLCSRNDENPGPSSNHTHPGTVVHDPECYSEHTRPL